MCVLTSQIDSCVYACTTHMQMLSLQLCVQIELEEFVIIHS